MERLKEKQALAIFAVVPCIVAFFLFAFSIAPLSGCGWIHAYAYLPVKNCLQIPGCANDKVRFQVQVNPFYATILFNSGTLEIQRIAWSQLNTKDLCVTNGTLHTDYAVPNKMCSQSTNDFVAPGAIPLIQAMTVLSILFSAFTGCFAIGAAASASRKISCCFFTVGTLTLIFASVALGTWNSFAVPQNFMKGYATATPVFNGSIVYEGQVLVRTKHSSRWEDVYSYEQTSTLVGTTPLQAVNYASGYNLWIAGVVFVSMAQLIVCVTGCSLVKDGCDRSGGGFGSGVYRPVSRDGFTPLDPEQASFAPEFSSADPNPPRPSQPAPPPPELNSSLNLKKDW